MAKRLARKIRCLFERVPTAAGVFYRHESYIVLWNYQAKSPDEIHMKKDQRVHIAKQIFPESPNISKSDSKSFNAVSKRPAQVTVQLHNGKRGLVPCSYLVSHSEKTRKTMVYEGHWYLGYKGVGQVKIMMNRSDPGTFAVSAPPTWKNPDNGLQEFAFAVNMGSQENDKSSIRISKIWRDHRGDFQMQAVDKTFANLYRLVDHVCKHKMVGVATLHPPEKKGTTPLPPPESRIPVQIKRPHPEVFDPANIKSVADVDGQSLYIDSASLGSGAFSEAFPGEIYHRASCSTAVCIKRMRRMTVCPTGDQFKEHARRLARIHKSRLVRLVCVVRLRTGVYVVWESMPLGPLDAHLRKATLKGRTLRPSVRLSILFDISNAMKFLEEKEETHGALRARNCFVSGDDGHSLMVKVADYGVGVPALQTDRFYIETEQEESIPYRWMAPESLSHRIFNPRTDVWSFGVVIYEVSTDCVLLPHFEHNLDNLWSQSYMGAKPRIPPEMDKVLARMANKCWSDQAQSRPNFRRIYHELNQLLTTALSNESSK